MRSLALSLSFFLSHRSLARRFHIPASPHLARVPMRVQIVEASWAQLDKVTPDTFAKLMLRAFAGYVIYR